MFLTFRLSGKIARAMSFLPELGDAHDAGGHQRYASDITEKLSFGQNFLDHHEESNHSYPKQIHNPCDEE